MFPSVKWDEPPTPALCEAEPGKEEPAKPFPDTLLKGLETPSSKSVSPLSPLASAASQQGHTLTQHGKAQAWGLLSGPWES